MAKRQCPLCGEDFNNKPEYADHLRDEFEDHQSSADTAADELRDMGEEL